MAREMEKPRKATSSPNKSSTIHHTGPKSPVRNGGSPPHKKNTTEPRGRKNEQHNVRKGGHQDMLSHDEGKRRSSSTAQTSPKRSPRHEQPLSYNRLHTEERAIRRAGYNYQVATKINTQEIIRRFEEKLAQLMEEREIKLMRKEMVPKAQLMPAFDKPFHPQRDEKEQIITLPFWMVVCSRSTRPLTVPKEPSFLRLKCCIGGEFHRHFCYNGAANNNKAIK